MKKFALALCVSLLPVLPAFALDDTPQNRAEQADRYMKTTPPKAVFEQMVEKIAVRLPEEDRQSFRELMQKHFAFESIGATMRDNLIKHFTADELKALADFYGSDIAKSAMSKIPAYMQDVMPEVEQEIGKALEKVEAEEKAAEAAKEKKTE